MRSSIGLFLACASVSFLTGTGHAQQKPTTVTPLNDLDTFMAKVLERRNDNWRTLHDYILSEREQFLIVGPGGIRLDGLDREFHWFVQDGYLVRSPVKANGVALGETERRQYEQKWMADEKQREQRQKERDAKKIVTGVGDVVRQSGEPRFISEAYFMKFPFEPGNYYLVGRGTLEERDVVIVEYYPSRMFKDDEEENGTTTSVNATGNAQMASKDQRTKSKTSKPSPKERNKDDELEQDIQRSLNKVSRVTMWIDSEDRQIVKYAFDNADFGFLPGRAIVRVDEARASMTMGRYFENVWLPKQISFGAGATLATGSYRFTYDRSFYDYRKGEVSARIRAYVPKDDK
ncbi:MAG: hypothetical protein NTV05_14870 [Acidobacteria bacterium]|nr:hypothetical protein [Acidobacteriota bacterium]